MGKEDYIQLQIEKLGRFLSFAISKLLGKEGEIESDYIQNTQSDLNIEFDFDWNQINCLNNDEFISYLQNKTHFNLRNIEYFANLLVLISEIELNSENRTQQLSKALAIYIYLNKTDKTYSEERNHKIKNLNSLIEI
jgi:ABC-type Na+ transport system ATPase subunit NatA